MKFAVRSNSSNVAAEYRLDNVKLAAAGPITAKYGAMLLTRVRANASGRPGPRAITGDYRRSWTLRLSTNAEGRRLGAGVSSATVGTNRPQARRLEFGFVGIDSLGRHYAQPPYPHAGPALDVIAPQYEAALVALLEAL